MSEMYWRRRNVGIIQDRIEGKEGAEECSFMRESNLDGTESKNVDMQFKIFLAKNEESVSLGGEERSSRFLYIKEYLTS